MARSRIGSRILPRWWILVGGDALDPPFQGQPGNEAQRPDEREAGTFPDLAWPICENARDVCPAEIAEEFIKRAETIAESLKLAKFGVPGVPR